MLEVSPSLTLSPLKEKDLNIQAEKATPSLKRLQPDQETSYEDQTSLKKRKIEDKFAQNKVLCDGIILINNLTTYTQTRPLDNEEITLLITFLELHPKRLNTLLLQKLFECTYLPIELNQEQNVLHVKLAEAFLNAGLPIDTKITSLKSTIPNWAICLTQGTEFLEKLKARGANFEEKDVKGYSPLHYAIMLHKKNQIAWLIEEGMGSSLYPQETNHPALTMLLNMGLDLEVLEKALLAIPQGLEEDNSIAIQQTVARHVMGVNTPEKEIKLCLKILQGHTPGLLVKNAEGIMIYTLFSLYVRDRLKHLTPLLTEEELKISQTNEQNKFMGHRFGIASCHTLDQGLLGSNSVWAIKELIHSFKSFLEAGPLEEVLANNILKTLETAPENENITLNALSNKLAKSIQDIREQLPVGLKYINKSGHATACVFYKNYTAFCNRGDLSNQMDEEHTLGIRIKNRTKRYAKSTLKKIQEGDQETWKRIEKSNDLVTFTTKCQIVGNCTWASHKLALLAIIFFATAEASGLDLRKAQLSEIEETKSKALKIYKAWSLWDRREAYSKYHKNPHRNIELLAKCALKKYLLFIDRAYLNNALCDNVPEMKNQIKKIIDKSKSDFPEWQMDAFIQTLRKKHQILIQSLYAQTSSEVKQQSDKDNSK